MSDFIPDDKFVPDEQPVQAQAQPQVEQAKTPDFIPEEQFQSDDDKYGTTLEYAKTAAEGALRGATMGASSAVLKALGDTGELERMKANPITSGVGEGVGFGASALVPVYGEASMAGRAGVAAAAKLGLGLEGASLASRLGAAGVKEAINMTAMQTGNEISKAVLQDPEQHVDTALAQIGLSAALGAAGGAAFTGVHDLWSSTAGKQVESVLNTLKNKTGLTEAAEDINEALIKKAGIEVTPELRAAIGESPAAKEAGLTLSQSDTKSGLKYQKALTDLKSEAESKLAENFGKTIDQVKSLPEEVSKYEKGKAIGETLAKEYSERLGPIAEKFEKLKSKYKGVDLEPDHVVKEFVPNADPYLPTVEREIKQQGTISRAQDLLGDLAVKEGWHASPSSDIMKELNRAMKELENVKTLKGLNEYITAVGENTKSTLPFGQQTPVSRAGSLIKNVLKDVEDDVVMKNLGKEAPHLIDEYKLARSEYRAQSLLKEELNDRLKVGGSTSGFAKGLREMAATDGESLLNRISGKNDAHLLQFLSENFPRTAEAVRNYHVESTLATAAKAAKGEAAMSADKLISAINGMSPELRGFSFKPEQLEKVNAISDLLNKFKSDKYNFSNTARTSAKLLEWMPGAAIGTAAMIAGHNPAIALLLGGLAKSLGRDAPDAIRLATLKFMGSNQPISSVGFKSMVEMIDNGIKGQKLLDKAASSVFRGSGEVFNNKISAPSAASRDKLDKRLKDLRDNPDKLIHIGSDTAQYMPQHGARVSAVAMNAAKILNPMRPESTQKKPLDTPTKPSSAQQSAYHRVLDLAEQPLLILKDVKNGTLKSNDVALVKTLYPGLYRGMVQKLTDEMIEHTSKGGAIPYETKMSLSLLLGQPMDSTMTPESIMSTQPQPPQLGQQSPDQQGQKPKHSMTALNKMPGMYQTPGQARQAQKLS